MIALLKKYFLYHELKDLKVHGRWQILEVLQSFISFLYAFDRKRGHIMLVLMFDMWFKNMWFMISYLGRDCTIVVVIEYDEKLFLPLLIKASKLLMHVSVEEIEIFQFQNNAKNLFHPITKIVDTYKDLVSRKFVGFY
jgi:hypothetical protein